MFLVQQRQQFDSAVNTAKNVFILYHNHSRLSSSFITYHHIKKKSYTTGATSGAGRAYTFRVHEFTPGLIWIRVCSVFVLLCSVL